MGWMERVEQQLAGALAWSGGGGGAPLRAGGRQLLAAPRVLGVGAGVFVLGLFL